MIIIIIITESVRFRSVPERACPSGELITDLKIPVVILKSQNAVYSIVVFLFCVRPVKGRLFDDVTAATT